MTKIVIDKNIPYVADALKPYAQVTALRGSEIKAADVRDADALLVRTRTRCDKELLDGSGVKLVATATIGFDHIDTDYCRRNGIEVVTAAGCNARGVLQWVASVLACVVAGRGRRADRLTLGVIGVGHVGSLVADYARLWGFRVICSDPPRERAEHLSVADSFYPIDELARQADIITFHPRLVRDGEDATFHLCGERFLRSVQRGAIIINSSRGEVVDNAALFDAVKTGLCECCLDVWEGEPNLNEYLLERALVASPHIAGYTVQGKANAAAAVVRAAARRFDLPIAADWYPLGIAPSKPAMPDWKYVCATIADYCDVETESRRLKLHPADFESMRDDYCLREEYF